MRLPIAIVAALLLTTSFAEAQQPPGEQLFVPPPKGWDVAYQDQKANVAITELVPAGQTARDWTEMLTVQVITGRLDKAPADVLKDQLADVQAACDDVGAGPVTPETENGYEVAIRAVACTKSKQWGKGELNLYKVIRGRDRYYVVARSWRGEPFQKEHLPVSQETTAAWLAFMQQVVVCDTRDPQRPCPTPHAAAGQK